LVPPLGNINAYISAVNALPMLTLEEEQAAARRLRDEDDLASASQLFAIMALPPYPPADQGLSGE
jgi:RNA polymerase sigma-32 factor